MSVTAYQQLKLIVPEHGHSGRRNINHTSAVIVPKISINPPSKAENGTPAEISESVLGQDSATDEDESTTLADDRHSQDALEVTGTQVGFADVTEIHEDGADKPEVMLTSKRKQGSSRNGHDRFSAKSIVLRRRYRQSPGKEPEHMFNFVEINDETIRNAIRHCLGTYPFAKLSGSQITFTEPFCELFHYRQALEDYTKTPDKTELALEKLSLLQVFIDDYLNETFKAYNEYVPNGYVTFDYVWTLYRPNSTVLVREHGQYRCYRVAKCYLDTPNWRIRCYSWGYREGHFGRVKTKLDIKPFDGQRKILDLDAVPFDMLPGEERQCRLSQLVERGRKWKSLCYLSHKRYDGVLCISPTLPQANVYRHCPST